MYACCAAGKPTRMKERLQRCAKPQRRRDRMCHSFRSFETVIQCTTRRILYPPRPNTAGIVAPLPSRLEQLDRIPVGIFDLDLSTGRPGFHVVSEMNARFF